MTKHLLTSALLTTALASAASASTYTFNLGSGSFSGTEGLTLTESPLDGDIIAFSLTFDFVGGGGSWASDAALGINDLQWGGYNYLIPGHTFQDFWSFDGPGSEASGTYTDSRSGLSISTAGGVNFRFVNAWTGSTAVQYNNVTVVVETIPAPGAVALLGLVGLVGRRRRG
jgi:hypothetical protein